MNPLADWSITSEQDVLLAAQVGDDRAFTELHRRYQPKMIGFFLSRGVAYDDVEDCCQIVWMGIVRHLKRFDTSKSFGTWVYTCCLNRYRNYIRELRQHGCVIGLEDEVGRTLVDTKPTPEEAIETTLELERVEKQLSKTPEHPGVEALLLWAQGYTYAEIAEIQQVKGTTVKMRIHHARKKLAAL